MALIKSLFGIEPQFGSNCWLAETATVIGKVKMGNDCSIWFNAVLRGDVNDITLGNKVNVQDNAMIHCTYQKAATTIGNEVSIGHNAIVHGCTIEDKVLIGMGAIVMDHAHVGTGAIIAAGAVVRENEKIPPYTLWAGIPAKQVKELDPKTSVEKLEKLANNYVMYSAWYKNEQ
ncbi:MAG: gamma carbonic anhydrase family protein [Chitinophagales bacterium]|nr:gamma carbonic anhydrase family protein [Chitinophagales bacterium]